ncbi:S8 family serine peptidase [Candidatus Thiothrix sp. Deng01]|uniref:S8 family serine peptidase n=1 Tax=Candidatus Thiothrix phosphatis TaxID=3112415 RepID=A0ABU6CSL7_9GAMM|nr:S8 family serine peptidase [Candidatus Thiothrix sp. Deng01]MEB4589769.1 S8 family serine peptidase [Candidatus Thiothrix sp. Deng01]
MFSPRFLSVSLLAAMIGGILASQAASANVDAGPSAKPSATTPATPDTDRMIIRFKDGASTNAVDKVLTRMRSEKGERFQYVKTTQQHSDVFKFGKSKKKAEWDSLSTWLQSQPEIDYAEPDFIMTKMDAPAPVEPDDTYLSYQWPLLDPVSGINAEQAWGYTTGEGSVVAVVDTGVLPHADLLPNLLPGYDMIADSFAANDGNGRDVDPTDPGDFVLPGECGSASGSNSSWHGTHVAGTIAAVGDNGEGVAGVAYGAKVLPVRALGKCGGYTSDIADAVVWASGGAVAGAPANPAPARVVNLSLGGPSSCGRTMQNAIKAARSNNAVVVAAAGNSNADASQFSPANCSGVITVAAVGREGGKAFYSNYGGAVDIAAPGGSVNDGVKENAILSTLNTGKRGAEADTYAYYQGTSMAAPHVSGVVALMLAANPALTPDQVESLLKSSARAFPKACSGCGTGLLDANAAVQAALGATQPPAPTPTNPVPTTDLAAVLAQNSKLWRSQNIRSYTYTLEQQRGSTTPLRLQLTIRSGKLYSGIDLTTNKPLSARDLKAKGKTVEQLFAVIGYAINNKAASITAAYDSALGYPVAVSIDQSSTVTGDEISLKASTLTKR